MLILSHRGLRDGGFENTLEAFDRAVEAGVDGIETDIRLSRDGRAVLYHDRLAPGGEPVASLTRKELTDQAGCSVPTLDEALARHPELFWILEIKTPETVDACLETLRHTSLSRPCLVISFWHTVIKRVSDELNVECGLSVRHRPLDFASLGLASDRNGSSVTTVIWDFEFLDAELVREAAAHGWRNLVFGAETAAEHDRCRRLGVDGIITDHPHLLLAAEEVTSQESGGR